MKAGRIMAICISSVAAATIGATCFLIPPYAEITTEFGVVKPRIAMTETMAADAIVEQIRNAAFTVENAGGSQYEVRVGDVMSEIDRGAIISSIQEMPCIERVFGGTQTIEVADSIAFDKDFLQVVLKTHAGDEEEPQNAYIQYSDKERQFIIKKETTGSVLIDNAADLVADAVEANSVIRLSDIGAYKKADVLSTDMDIRMQCMALNQYKGVDLTYFVDKSKENLNFDTIHEFLLWDSASKSVLVDREKVENYVAELAKTYTTVGKSRQFLTSTDEYIDIDSGDYGWILNEKAMVNDIISHIEAQESYTGDFIFSRKGDAFGDEDYGGNYIEISIENQHLWMYQNGECVLDTDVVTGNLAQKHYTNKGVFYLKSKARNCTLRGSGYASYVRYWMPFNGGIGIFDLYMGQYLA